MHPSLPSYVISSEPSYKFMEMAKGKRRKLEGPKMQLRYKNLNQRKTVSCLYFPEIVIHIKTSFKDATLL